MCLLYERHCSSPLRFEIYIEKKMKEIRGNRIYLCKVVFNKTEIILFSIQFILFRYFCK